MYFSTSTPNYHVYLVYRHHAQTGCALIRSVDWESRQIARSITTFSHGIRLRAVLPRYHHVRYLHVDGQDRGSIPCPGRHWWWRSHSPYEWNMWCRMPALVELHASSSRSKSTDKKNTRLLMLQLRQVNSGTISHFGAAILILWCKVGRWKYTASYVWMYTYNSFLLSLSTGNCSVICAYYAY